MDFSRIFVWKYLLFDKKSCTFESSIQRPIKSRIRTTRNIFLSMILKAPIPVKRSWCRTSTSSRQDTHCFFNIWHCWLVFTVTTTKLQIFPGHEKLPYILSFQILSHKLRLLVGGKVSSAEVKQKITSFLDFYKLV